MNSMTGFGRAECDLSGVRVSVTAQSWNHRNADLVFRLPERLRGLEAKLRPAVLERIRRGRCEIAVRMESAEGAAGWRLDRAGLESVVEQARELIANERIERRVSIGDLLRSPFVVADSVMGSPPGSGRVRSVGILNRLTNKCQASGSPRNVSASIRNVQGAR